MIKLLLDENFPLPAVRKLKLTGWDIQAIAETHASIDDREVLLLACTSARWLVTFDRDFGELIYGQQLAAPPAILLLRVQHYSPTEPASWVENWVRHTPSMQNSFTVFDGMELPPFHGHFIIH